MTDVAHVLVRVLPGRSVTTPDGVVHAGGETLAMTQHEAEFAVMMGAAEIAADDPAPKAGRKAKAESE